MISRIPAAPMKAKLITAAMKPPPMMTVPIRGGSQPAMTAPMMPTMMSPSSPKPPPARPCPRASRQSRRRSPNDDALRVHRFPLIPATAKRLQAKAFAFRLSAGRDHFGTVMHPSSCCSAT
jgi:hypothetical protein